MNPRQTCTVSLPVSVGKKKKKKWKKPGLPHTEWGKGITILSREVSYRHY